MALSEFEHKRCEHMLDTWLNKRRPPPHIRPQLDYGYVLEGQSVELQEIRQMMDGELLTRSFARMTYVRTQNVWRLYWMRADLKWHAYEPATYRWLEDALAEVERDPMGCFYG